MNILNATPRAFIYFFFCINLSNIAMAQEIQYPVAPPNEIPPDHAHIQAKILRIDKSYNLSEQAASRCERYGCKALVEVQVLGAMGMGFQPLNKTEINVIFNCTLAPDASANPPLEGLKKNDAFEALIRAAESSDGYTYTIDSYKKIPKK